MVSPATAPLLRAFCGVHCLQLSKCILQFFLNHGAPSLKHHIEFVQEGGSHMMLNLVSLEVVTRVSVYLDRNSHTDKAEWAGALSQWRNQYPIFHFLGHFHFQG